MFQFGRVETDSAIAPSAHPVVLLSHGTGGTAESLGWLAYGLAAQGYLVLGANHHGNTGLEPYRPEGFLCWWERTRDLSCLLSMLSGSGPFAQSMDLGSVFAVGFSVGGPTVLALLGAQYSVPRFEEWRSDNTELADGPLEFPDLSSRIEGLLATSEVFRTSWRDHDADLTDTRVRGVVALAAAPPVRAFRSESLGAIDRPVLLLTGEADAEAPTEMCTNWLMTQNPTFRQVSMGSDVGHYSFLGLPQHGAEHTVPYLFADAPSVSRADLHQRCLARILEAIVP